jgi:hypothetical protein
VKIIRPQLAGEQIAQRSLRHFAEHQVERTAWCDHGEKHRCGQYPTNDQDPINIRNNPAHDFHLIFLIREVTSLQWVCTFWADQTQIRDLPWDIPIANCPRQRVNYHKNFPASELSAPVLLTKMDVVEYELRPRPPIESSTGYNGSGAQESELFAFIFSPRPIPF